MIAVIRSIDVHQGKMPQAVEFAKKVAKQLSEAHGIESDVAVPVGGNPNKIAWHFRLPDLAAAERLAIGMGGDASLQKLLAEYADTGVAGTVHDQLWRTI